VFSRSGRWSSHSAARVPSLKTSKTEDIFDFATPKTRPTVQLSTSNPHKETARRGNKFEKNHPLQRQARFAANFSNWPQHGTATAEGWCFSNLFFHPAASVCKCDLLNWTVDQNDQP
jgi:hypothetical protein